MTTIAFFGLPLAALLLDGDGHRIAVAALSRSDVPGRRRLSRRIGADRVCMKPDVDDPAFIDRVRRLEPDLVVSWFWTTRLPLALLETARWGGINAHPSLLPRHRGPDPTYWAIAAGDATTGVTIHRLAADYDTGPILAQESLDIDPAYDALALARALDRPSLRLLRATVARIARGEAIPERVQDERLATSAPFLDDEGAAIRWSWTVGRILRHVRGLSPAPGAFAEIAGSVVTVLAAEHAGRIAIELAPGEAAALAGRAIVGAADGAVALRTAEIDGEPAGPPELCALIERAAFEGAEEPPRSDLVRRR